MEDIHEDLRLIKDLIRKQKSKLTDTENKLQETVENLDTSNKENKKLQNLLDEKIKEIAELREKLKEVESKKIQKSEVNVFSQGLNSDYNKILKENKTMKMFLSSIIQELDVIKSKLV